jgi:tetratricopeptide (TPR) repeat protein
MLRSVIIIVLASFSLSASAQDNELKEIFTKAEDHYLYNEYELANPLYLILNDYAGNANISYKIGNCYLNIEDEKPRAIPFLEQAITNYSYDANETDFKEQRAPIDAFFSLSTAYRINNEFEKALNTYSKIKDLLPEKGKLENSDFIDQQINACRNAISFIENEVPITKEDLGPDINVGSINTHAVISGDGNTLVFTEKRGLENTIYYVKKERSEWVQPVDITTQLGDARDCSSSSLNYDGTVLYLYKDDNYDGNIYTSTYSNSSWSKIHKLNRNINTRFFESHACESADGSRLYFSSNRDGGEGALDIYVSELDENGEWGEAVNLGASINTPFNEDTPFITTNDSSLFFSSEGHTSMGGYDIFESKRIGNIWKTPSNVGYPLSTSDNDLFFQPVNNGANGYYSYTTGYKERHIHYVTIGGREKEPRVFEIKGIVSLSDTIIEFTDDFKVTLFSTLSGDTVDVSYPNKSTGFYSFLVKGDEYKLLFEGIGYLQDTVNIALYEDHPDDEEVINMTLEPDENYEPIPEIVEKLDYSQIQVIEAIDSSILVTNLIVRDVSDSDSTNVDVLYYTVQVMALYNPVDVSFFRNTEVAVLYNSDDKFYRYTTGKFKTKEEAYKRRDRLIQLGYPEDIFVKTVFRGNQE